MLQYIWICLNNAWIYLNMYVFTIIDRYPKIFYTIHNARLLYSFMSTFWQMDVFRTLTKIQKSNLEKNYGTVLNIPGFQSCQIFTYVSATQGSECLSMTEKCLHCTKKWSCLKNTSGSQYIRDWIVTNLWTCKSYKESWLCLNNH